LTICLDGDGDGDGGGDGDGDGDGSGGGMLTYPQYPDVSPGPGI